MSDINQKNKDLIHYFRGLKMESSYIIERLRLLYKLSSPRQYNEAKASFSSRMNLLTRGLINRIKNFKIKNEDK